MSDPNTDSLLAELCAALGQRGGTRHDALQRVRRLRAATSAAHSALTYWRDLAGEKRKHGDQQVADYLEDCMHDFDVALKDTEQ